MAKAVRRITADKKVLIGEMVEVLYPFLPLKSRGKGAVHFYSIFKESKVHHYLGSSPNKKHQLQRGFENLLRFHQNLPFTIIRKIIPASIGYRRHKRNPLKREELNILSDLLFQLGIDMKSELAGITIDETVPEIQVPTNELIKRLEQHPLVPEIASEPLQQFKNGHFNESVRKAAERYESKIQKLSGSTDIGKRLMSRVFTIPAPTVKINDLTTENEKSAQEGFQYLSMGMMQAIRNIFSHGDEDQRSPEEAYEMLLFINWLFRQLNFVP